tara:strand:+ start:76 stop:951 length:876 start_codon:yes stop_codon:yes gene_type:complete
MATLLKLTDEPGDNKTQNADGTVSYTIKYTAIFDADVENAFEADSLAGFFKGKQLSFATSLTLQNWTTVQTTNLKVWVFNCSFVSSTFEAGSSTNTIEIEPFSWSETREKVVNNTVGDPMFPAVQDTEYWSGINIIYNDANLDMSLYEIGGAVNDTQITVAGISIPPYCMKAGGLGFRKVSDGLTDTWQLVLPLYLCFKKARGAGASHSIGTTIGFQKEVVNNGFRVHQGTVNDPLVKIKNEDGDDITSPERINSTGTAILAPGEPDWSILVLPTELNDFSSFNLPTSAPS